MTYGDEEKQKKIKEMLPKKVKKRRRIVENLEVKIIKN